MTPFPSRASAYPFTLLLLLFCSASRLASQVNTEAMRRDNLSPGLHNRIGLNLEYQSGNSDFLSIGASYRLDYLAGAAYSFLVASYDRRSSGDVLNRNEGFAHVRMIYALDSLIRPEAFLQKEFNDFILLRDRNLAGAGLRLRPVALHDSGTSITLFLGIGGMYESELLEQAGAERIRLFRSTNYITLQGRFGEIATLTATGYYQVAPSLWDDFRVLAEGELAIRLSDLLGFVVSSRYRYDNLPPAGLRNFDFRVRNGVTVTF